MSVSGLGSNLLLNASERYDPAGAEAAKLRMQQGIAQNAMAMAPVIYAGPNVFAPQPAAPSPAGGPRPPMPGQASTPAPAPAPAQAPIPPYKAMPGTPGAASTSAPVSLPPKPAPQPAAPQSAAAAPASAPAWAQPTFQPVDIATAEQQFYANPQLRQQAMARRDYLIQQGIPAATAESWVNQDVAQLWGMQQQALQYQNDQNLKFMQEQEKLLGEQRALYKVEHPGAASQIGRLMEDVRNGKITKKQADDRIAAMNRRGLGLGGAGGATLQDTVDFYTDMALRGNFAWKTGLSRSSGGSALILAVEKNMPKRAKALGLTANDVAMRMAEFGGIQSEERAIGTRAGQIGMAANEANNMADIVLQNSKKFQRTKYPPVNAALAAYREKTGDPAVVSYGAALNSFINAYARAINPTGTPTVYDKSHATEVLSRALNQTQLEAAIATLKQEMQAAQQAPAETRASIRGEFTQGGQGAQPTTTGKTINFGDLPQ